VTFDDLKLNLSWKSLKAAEPGLEGLQDGGGDQVTQRVGGIVAAETFFVGVGFEDVGGLVGVVLRKGRQSRRRAHKRAFTGL